MIDFVEFLKQEKIITDRVLKEFLDNQIEEAGRLDGEFGIMVKKIGVQVLRGGKRARPMLVRLGYRVVGGKENEDLVKASLFTELIHQNLLVHDDIADRDYKRYGGKTLEVEFGDWFEKRFGKKNPHFGLTLAMLAGDHLRTLAHVALFETVFENERKAESMRLMSRVLGETLAGWQIQYWQNFEEIDIEQEKRFLKGLELVTARYSFEAPLMIGVVLAGEGRNYEAVMKQYARYVGTAFQITDDILGVFGNTEETGKPSGNDIREGKKTLLVLRAYKKATGRQRKILREIVGRENLSEEELEKVRRIIEETGSLENSKMLAKKNADKAMRVLKKVKTTDRNAVRRLEQLADFVVRRSY